MTSVHDLSLQDVLVTKVVEKVVVVDGTSEEPIVDMILEEDSTDAVGKVDEEMEDVKEWTSVDTEVLETDENEAEGLSLVVVTRGMLVEGTEWELVVELLTNLLGVVKDLDREKLRTNVLSLEETPADELMKEELTELLVVELSVGLLSDEELLFRELTVDMFVELSTEEFSVEETVAELVIEVLSMDEVTIEDVFERLSVVVTRADVEEHVDKLLELSTVELSMWLEVSEELIFELIRELPVELRTDELLVYELWVERLSEDTVIELSFDEVSVDELWEEELILEEP